MQALTELDGVIKKTLTAVQEGKNQIVTIADGVRLQRDELLVRLVELKSEILTVITKVDRLEREDKLARFHLMRLSANSP